MNGCHNLCAISHWYELVEHPQILTSHLFDLFEFGRLALFSFHDNGNHALL